MGCTHNCRSAYTRASKIWDVQTSLRGYEAQFQLSPLVLRHWQPNVRNKNGKNSNFYEKLYEKREILDNFDFSNYPSDHFLYNAENKLTVLKFKDEFPGDIITEFVALKPKLFSILSQSKYISFKITGSKLFKERFLFSKIKKFRKIFQKKFLKYFEKKMSKNFV